VPLQNRVAATGELMVDAGRGLLMGNRGGQIHKPDRTLGRRRWSSRAWIACVLDYKGRHEQIWVDHHYTQLFFLDEATALAAGHRPCALCRRADFRRFATLWAETGGLPTPPKVAVMDAELHAERWASRDDSAPVNASPGSLPDGSVVVHDTAPHLIDGGRLWRWSFEGYQPGPGLEAIAPTPVVTPPSIVRILAAGYRPMLHPSVRG
jgi:hypothetical protein